MKFEEILNGIKELAKSQGFYCRLYRDLMEDDELMENFKKATERQNFTDIVDFVMWLES